jgi:hypothetical protein
MGKVRRTPGVAVKVRLAKREKEVTHAMSVQCQDGVHDDSAGTVVFGTHEPTNNTLKKNFLGEWILIASTV